MNKNIVLDIKLDKLKIISTVKLMADKSRKPIPYDAIVDTGSSDTTMNKTVNSTQIHNFPTPPPISTVDAYIAGHEGDIRERMEKLRALILSCSPDITEKIAWGMPTFILNGNLVHFAAAKRHIGFYPGASGVTAFIQRTTEFKHSKGAVQLPNDKPMPYDLIREVVMLRIEENKK